MSALRWILLVSGVVIVAAIYLIGRYREKGRSTRREPALGFNDNSQSDEPPPLESGEVQPAHSEVTDAELELLDFDDLVARGLETEIVDYRPPAVPSHSKAQDTPVQKARSESMLLEQELVVLNLSADAGQQFLGNELYAALYNAGFLWKDDKIFHCQASKGEYIALNALKPGVFPEDAADFSTPAVALILQLPSVDDPVAAFDEFLNLARQLQSDLQARLCDGQRSSLTGQTIAYLRDEVSQYQFKHR